jgi:hypothetical protein
LLLALVVLFEAAYKAWSRTPGIPTLIESPSQPTVQDRIYIDFKPHIEARGGEQTQTAPSQPAPSAPISEEPKATHNVQLIRPKSVYVEHGISSLGFYERQYKTNHKAFVACFRNEPIFGRSDIVDANSVMATAHYFDTDEQEILEGIAGLCWLGDTHDYINFEVGKKTHNVVLAIMDLRDESFVVPFIKRAKSRMGSNLLEDRCLFRKEIAHITLWLMGRENQPLLPAIYFDLRKTASEWELIKRPS